MKYIGAFTVLLAAVLISREYARYIKRRAVQCEEFLSFIAYMRIQIACFLRPIKEIAAGFYASELDRIGFLKAVNDGQGLYDAYKTAEKSLLLSSREREVLEALFSSLGECYLDDGIRIIDSSYAEMEKLCRIIKEERPKKARLAATLSVTASIGFLILVL